MGKPDASKGIDEMHEKSNVAIIPHLFMENTGKVHLGDLITLIQPLTTKIFVITGGEGRSDDGSYLSTIYDNTTPGVEIIPIKCERRRPYLLKVFQHVRANLQILRVLLTLRKEIDILVFFLGGTFPAQFILAKCLNIACWSILTGTGLGDQKKLQIIKKSGVPRQLGERAILSIRAALEPLTYRLSDKLIVYNEDIIDLAGLRKYNGKIVAVHRHFVNFDEYQWKDNIEQRNNVVTYVGRLDVEKGVLPLVEAIPLVLNKSDARFVIIGEGPLEDQIRSYLTAQSVHDAVKLTGWIPHQELPDFYAESKLLVLPSYTEGLPHVMLEAMACGTPVLATSVGAVPNVITDKETGFFMHDNSPKCVAETIVDALEYPNLKQIVVNARNLVESQFRYERTVETWANIIYNAKHKQS